MDDEDEDEDAVEYGLVNDLVVEHGLVCASPEGGEAMINFLIDHGKLPTSCLQTHSSETR